MMELKPTAANKCFEGVQKIFSHQSSTLGCTMNFAIYLPPQADDGKVPVIYWLSGLNCTETNFVQKAGAQRLAAKYGVAIVCPDTSPRGVNIPGEDDSWDFGSGAGFYVNATREPWKKNYQMFSYVTEELPEIINKNFPVLPEQQSIMGHSMGGHGALVCALKNPGKYRTVSAFAPICNPSSVPWGQKAFEGYLGSQTNEAGENVWADWDSTLLVEKYSGPPLQILIDVGKDDQFLQQLSPDAFVEACQRAKMPVILHKRDGYDHSYFFIATFIEDHIKHHLQYLKGLVE